ncbi:retrotransposon protein, putative, ty3-gypsy subclass [Tanacetum coccineum]
MLQRNIVIHRSIFDDILVFSMNEKEHAKHLEKMLKICEDNGLVSSLTKMKIAVSTIDFLGSCLRDNAIGNEGISSSISLLSGGSSTVPQCLSEEYEDHLRRSHEDFQPFPRIFTMTIFTHEEPGALYRHYQLKANQTLIRIDKSNAWRSVAQDIEISTAKEATTTGLTREKTSELKKKKQGESLLNWKALPNDWAATTSKLKEVQPNNPEENMYRLMERISEDDDSQ